MAPDLLLWHDDDELLDDRLQIIVRLNDTLNERDRNHLLQRASSPREYELLGMAPGDHVMRLYRQKLKARGVLTSSQLMEQRNGQMVQVAGMVVVRQRPPTAKGHVFITLEDEEGLSNLIIRPKVYARYKDTLRNKPLLLITGKLQREGQAVSVLVQSGAPLS